MPEIEIAEFHEVANLFPLMEEQGLADLAVAIAANGLREPIWRHRDGRIIDGRNRWLACQRAGVQCQAHTFEGEDDELLAFVLQYNLHRRHLTESQRAMVGGRVANMNAWRSRSSDRLNVTSRAQAGAMVNVSDPSIGRARRVLRAGAPELIASVDRGELSVAAAAKLSGLPPEDQKKRLDKHKSGGGTAKRGPPKGTPKMKSQPVVKGIGLRVAFDRDDGLVEQVCSLALRLREVAAKTAPETLHARFPEKMMHNLDMALETATEFLIGLRNAHRARSIEKKNAAL